MKKPEDCENLEDIRRGIDTLDREIVALLGTRSCYVEAAAHFKTSEGNVRAPERQKAMLEEQRRWAEEEGLSPEMIENLYKTLLAYFVDRELRDWRSASETGRLPRLIGNHS